MDTAVSHTTETVNGPTDRGPAIANPPTGSALILPNRAEHNLGFHTLWNAYVSGDMSKSTANYRVKQMAKYARIEGRITTHSGRIGLASELTRRGGSIFIRDGFRLFEEKEADSKLEVLRVTLIAHGYF